MGVFKMLYTHARTVNARAEVLLQMFLSGVSNVVYVCSLFLGDFVTTDVDLL